MRLDFELEFYGTLEFKDSVPTGETARKARNAQDLIRALDPYNSSLRGASVYAISQGLESMGTKDNDVVSFSELLDSNSLFLTANADTVYYAAGLDLSKGPVVIEQPSNGLGTINDMWFSWVIDVGLPGPDRGLGGKYLIVGPDYDGPLPEGGYFVAHSKTNLALYAMRAFLVDNDPKPTVENIKNNLKIYPYQPGSFGTSIAQALEGEVRLGAEPTIPEMNFIEGSGKSFNTIPPSDFGFFEMINENVQSQPATSYDIELAGQLAAIDIVHGKEFKPDERMKKILTDAAAFGQAAGRALNWRILMQHPDWAYYEGSQYLMSFLDAGGNPFDGSKTYKVTLPKDVPAEKFWSFTVYDNQRRSMLQTPQKFPRAGSQSYPTPAAKAAADGSITIYFAPKQPKGVASGNWVQTDPAKGWFTIIRFYSPKPGFFDKSWRPSEIELVQ